MCPAAGKGAPGENKRGFICGCSITPLISVPAVHSVLVPFLMQVDEEQSPAKCVPCSRLCPVGLDRGAGIILGTHHEKGAFTFWSYAIGLPLPSSAILSWKFCHVLHKVLRDGHPNVSVPSETKLLALANVPLHRRGGFLPCPGHLLQAMGMGSPLLSPIFETFPCKTPTSGCH